MTEYYRLYMPPFYFISCSKLLNSGEEKNSSKVISNPSQSIFIVRMVGFAVAL